MKFFDAVVTGTKVPIYTIPQNIIDDVKATDLEDLRIKLNDMLLVPSYVSSSNHYYLYTAFYVFTFPDRFATGTGLTQNVIFKIVPAFLNNTLSLTHTIRVSFAEHHPEFKRRNFLGGGEKL